MSIPDSILAKILTSFHMYGVLLWLVRTNVPGRSLSGNPKVPGCLVGHFSLYQSGNSKTSFRLRTVKISSL